LENTYRRLYEENFRLSKEINETIKFCLTNEAYFKKYDVIKKTAERSYYMKKNLLMEMKKFDHITSGKADQDLNEKRKVYCDLEVEVNHIKDETLKFQKEIENIMIEINLKEKIIGENDIKNERISQDIRNMLRQNYDIKIKMLQIYDNFQVFNLDSIIKKFKEERIQYQGYYSIVRILFHTDSNNYDEFFSLIIHYIKLKDSLNNKFLVFKFKQRNFVSQ